MQRKSAEVRKFINDNNLKVDRRRDLERITSYYNSLWDIWFVSPQLVILLRFIKTQFDVKTFDISE